MHSKNKLSVCTWHIHGTYLYYLTQTPVEFYLPVRQAGLPVTNDDTPGYGGRAGTFPWGEHVHEIAASEVKNNRFDVIVYQSPRNYQQDAQDIFTEDQLRQTAQIYIEHDPPRESPTDTKHIVTDPRVLVVQVTHFNDLMWDTQGVPTKVIEHGVLVDAQAKYTGEKEKGIVVINNVHQRGRRLGLDVYTKLRKHIPLDLVGLNSTQVAGGIGEVPPHKITSMIGQYRFFCNPIRYTSLGLAIIEAMMVGLPVIGLATTELVTVIKNGYNGYIHTDVNKLIPVMKDLLGNKSLAKEWGNNARKTAVERFSIERFAKDWKETFEEATQRSSRE